MKRRLITVACVLAVVALAVAVGWYAGCKHAEDNKMNRDHKLPTPEQIAKLPPDGGEEYNRLVHETSPYLLQHADNPVDWYPWGPEAFAKAKAEDKPIFLSVGYSTCHWCHVMERESFERDDVAAILNKHYVAIKVDREERPDVDQIYMSATQRFTGSGGWPNSLWLTPDGRPWYAGTYFPREDAFGRPGFKTVLTALAKTWRERREDVNATADTMAEHIKRVSSAPPAESPPELSRELISAGAKAFAAAYDSDFGGFGGAPKFPPHGALRLLLSEHRRTKDKSLLDMATTTLDAMARGGIHDHLGGGFHRYSTDGRWLLPHFEKMLYDNAQLARVYVEAYSLTGDQAHRAAAVGIYEWVLREMADAGGGFHSALDADSEGEEGKFYVWRRDEIIEALGEKEGEIFCETYGVKEEGNFRDQASGEQPGTNILHLRGPIPAELSKRLAAGRATLLERRGGRVRPALDDKVVTSWNALMIGSLAYGGKHLNEPRYTAAARTAAEFILTHMRKDGRLLRTYRRGRAKLDAYLDDYAFLCDALIDLHEADGDKRWLAEAQRIADGMIARFGDPSGSGFFFTAADGQELLARTKDPFDSAIPAGNAIAARALARLAGHTGRREYAEAAKRTLETFAGLTERAPRGMATMLLALGDYLDVAPTVTSRPAGERPDAAAGVRPVSLAAFASALTVRPGEAINLRIRITTDEGWHINSNRPIQENLIPTSVALAPGSPAKLGDIIYPPGKEMTFAFSPEALSVYAGTVWVHATLTLGADAAPGPATVELLVNTQACNDRSCLAPQTHRLVLKVDVTRKAPAATKAVAK